MAALSLTGVRSRTQVHHSTPDPRALILEAQGYLEAAIAALQVAHMQPAAPKLGGAIEFAVYALAALPEREA